MQKKNHKNDSIDFTRETHPQAVQRIIHNSPSTVELGVYLHQVEDTTQEALAFSQWPHGYADTCS